jgi:CheY-like chemotaxis protein
MHILVASSSVFRQQIYRDAVESLGHRVSIVSGGVECVAYIQLQQPDLLILEAPLFWGGAEGVLQALQESQCKSDVPVILVAAGVGSIDWFQLSRFRIENLLFRVPTPHDLAHAISAVAISAAGKSNDRSHGRKESTLAQ